MLRSKSPGLAGQEVSGLLLNQYTLAALMCRAASEAGLDPDRLSPTRALRTVRRRSADPAAISPEDLAASVTDVQRQITRKRHLDPHAATAATHAKSNGYDA